jgi:hypothetical protein
VHSDLLQRNDLSCDLVPSSIYLQFSSQRHIDSVSERAATALAVAKVDLAEDLLRACTIIRVVAALELHDKAPRRA